jgi:hypothetical protein
MKDLEARIIQLEEDLKKLALKLQNPPGDGKLVQQLGLDYQQTQNQLGEIMEQWEALAVKLEG